MLTAFAGNNDFIVSPFTLSLQPQLFFEFLNLDSALGFGFTALASVYLEASNTVIPTIMKFKYTKDMFSIDSGMSSDSLVL
jgi:hypothetical protein